MKTDTFPRPAFRVSTDALRRVVVEPVTVHAVDKLRGVASCSFTVPGCTLRNDVPFAQLARDGRRAARLAARLVLDLDPAGVPAVAPFAVRARAIREQSLASRIFGGAKSLRDSAKSTNMRSRESRAEEAVPLPSKRD